MGLALLVVSLAFAAYLLGVKEIHSWQANLELENAMHLALQQVTRDLYRAEEIISLADEQGILRLVSGDTVIYSMMNGRLERNHQPLHSASLQMIEVRFRASTYANVDSIDMDSSIVNRNVGAVEVSFSLATEQRTLTAATTVSLRHTPTWTPLRPPTITHQLSNATQRDD